MIIRTLWAMLLSIALVFSLRADDHDKIPVRVVVVTTCESGGDSGPNASGEIANWVEQLPLKEKIEFPQGYHHLRYNRDLQVLGIVTGEGKSHAAASIMAVEMDPRFDLSKAYGAWPRSLGLIPTKHQWARPHGQNASLMATWVMRLTRAKFPLVGLPASLQSDARHHTSHLRHHSKRSAVTSSLN
jgi:hypothetical protein